MRYSFIIFLLFFCGCSSPSPKTNFSILFVGNSYTYYPSAADYVKPSSSNAYLPKILKQIVESKHPDLTVKFEYSTRGGFSFRDHNHHKATMDLLQKEYDAVILQGRSNESFQLPRWFSEQGQPDQSDFFKYGLKLIRSSKTPPNRIILYANWAYHPSHDYFKDSFSGLRFSNNHQRAGEKWYGKQWTDATVNIESNYQKLAKSTGARVARVGQAWLHIYNQHQGPVQHDDLYWNLKDLSHPSYLGAYLTACVLYRALFSESCEGAAYEVGRMDHTQALHLQRTSDLN